MFLISVATISVLRRALRCHEWFDCADLKDEGTPEGAWHHTGLGRAGCPVLFQVHDRGFLMKQRMLLILHRAFTNAGLRSSRSAGTQLPCERTFPSAALIIHMVRYSQMHSEALLGGPTGRIIGGLYYVNHKAEIAVLRSSFIVQ